MKNEHFDQEQRNELRALKNDKNREATAQMHVYQAAETTYNDYRDSHTGQVQPLLQQYVAKLKYLFSISFDLNYFFYS